MLETMLGYCVTRGFKCFHAYIVSITTPTKINQQKKSRGVELANQNVMKVAVSTTFLSEFQHLQPKIVPTHDNHRD